MHFLGRRRRAGLSELHKHRVRGREPETNFFIKESNSATFFFFCIFSGFFLIKANKLVLDDFSRQDSLRQKNLIGRNLGDELRNLGDAWSGS
jgi:hypothetical protein